MNWSPDPYPTMARIEYERLRDYMIEHDGWGDLPAVVVDDEDNLIDGYKRHTIFTQLANERGWPKTAPAYVLETSGLSDAERAKNYTELRRVLNGRLILIDEIDTWLKTLRETQ